MTARSPHISLVTLGVADIGRARRFYEALGLRRAGFDNDGVAFYDMGGTALGLFPRANLAADAGILDDGQGFRAVTLAWNQPSEADVDRAIAHAIASGAELVKPAEKVFWGGYSGYIADPDGHLWEIAHNPHWPLRDSGAMELPPPTQLTSKSDD
ncbi:MAG: VOC family protein [Proteobacteria bacterium]|nr:VOC family protein [Pseudomonadota bacterium]